MDRRWRLWRPVVHRPRDLDRFQNVLHGSQTGFLAMSNGEHREQVWFRCERRREFGERKAIGKMTRGRQVSMPASGQSWRKGDHSNPSNP